MRPLPVHRTSRLVLSSGAGLMSERMRMKCLSPMKSSALETASLLAEQRLGREDDERFAEAAQHLPAQDVEIIGRRRAVGDLDIALGAELQEALDARRAMLRSLAFIAVGQQQHEAVGAQPFALGRGDILVDDDLGAIGEVAELRFPHHQGLGVGHGIAIFEAEHAIFGQRAVEYVEPAMRHGREAGCSGAPYPDRPRPSGAG